MAAVDEEVIPFGRTAHEVVCVQPAVPHGRGRALGIVKVAQHQRRGAAQHLALVSVVAVLVDHAQFNLREGPADPRCVTAGDVI